MSGGTGVSRVPENEGEERGLPRALREPTDVDVTVVIGGNAPEDRLASCLSALEDQRERAQVVVVEAEESDPAFRRRFPWAEFHARPGALVPELWRDGAAEARGRIVAFTIAPMIPAPDWIDTIIRHHEGEDAVGGAIDPAPGLRWVDWAEYFCRYAREMAPFEPAYQQDIAGDNASYRRAHLIEAWDHLRTGVWEPILHPILRQRGVRLWHTPDMLVLQGRSSGFGTFARQRLEHGRLYAHQRGEDFSRLRHAIGVLASPVVPFLMTLRVMRDVFDRGRYRARAVGATPLIFVFNAAWALAEARGHLEQLLDR